MASSRATPSFAELFTPKLVTVLREGYGLKDLRADTLAAATVAIVALPLSMAIAIASGVTPDRGLYTAIVGGFVVSALAGSRFQIGGPAGAFIVLVAATVAQYGVDGLIFATMLSGIILLVVGLLRLGTFIKYIPYPVTVGFTAGIALVIFTSQIKDLLGLKLTHPEPGDFVPRLQALWTALPTVNTAAVTLAGVAIGSIVLIRRFKPHWPAFLVAAVLASMLAWGLRLPVETIGTRFGGIPRSLPWPSMPHWSGGAIAQILPAAAAFALLGGIESLLCAVVADSMTGRRHRSNAELVGQGVANIASACFGGFCVTGTIARTATNIRAGARGPIAGILHAVFLLLFLLVAAPLASFIPLAALAGILSTVAWNMAEKHQFATLLRASLGDALVLLATFLLVVFRDLTSGILVGFGLGVLLFLHRMAEAIEIERPTPDAESDVADAANGTERPYDASLATDPDVVVYRISGAFFFGAAAGVAAALDRIGEHPKAYVIDFAAVPLIDSTAAATIEGFMRKAHRKQAAVYLSGVSEANRGVLMAHGLRPPLVRYSDSIGDALAHRRAGQSGREAELTEERR
jgi:SulP family sulfate permease